MWDDDESDAAELGADEFKANPRVIAAVREEFLKGGITTLMLRNVPLARTQSDLIEEIDRCGFRGTYDFCYLPRTFKTGKNRGFAFVNFTNVDAAAKFKVTWHKSRRFRRRARDKPLDVGIAAVQGRDANYEMAVSAKMDRIKNADFRPYVIMPNQSES
jgi:hypothetical protein